MAYGEARDITCTLPLDSLKHKILLFWQFRGMCQGFNFEIFFTNPFYLLLVGNCVLYLDFTMDQTYLLMIGGQVIVAGISPERSLNQQIVP